MKRNPRKWTRRNTTGVQTTKLGPYTLQNNAKELSSTSRKTMKKWIRIRNSGALYPKKFINDTMHDWPEGSQLVLETSKSEGIDLLTIGYKYNQKKVLCFLSTKDAGHTEQGVCYEARWKDDNNNTRTRYVPHPEIVSKYFGKSNVIDSCNQSRQFDLKLEKHWLTECGYFRLCTTLFGITITDCWNGYKFHLNSTHHHKHMGILEFSKILCKDILRNSFTKTPDSNIALTISLPPPILSPDERGVQALQYVREHTTLEDNSQVSGLTITTITNNSSTSIPESRLQNVVNSDLLREAHEKHRLVIVTETESHKVKDHNGNIRVGKRLKRGYCMIDNFHKNTVWFCPECVPKIGAKRAWCCNYRVNFMCNKNHLKGIEREMYQ